MTGLAGAKSEAVVNAEVAALVRPHRRLRLPVPGYDGRCIANVSVSIARATGADRGGTPPLVPLPAR